MLLADHISYLADRATRRRRQQLQMFGLDAASLAEQSRKRRRATQPVPLIRAYCGFAPTLDREPGAALGAACAQDLAAADTLHAGAKTVCPLAPDDRRLISALHVLLPFKKSLTLERFASCAVKVIRDATRSATLWITLPQRSTLSAVTGSVRRPLFFGLAPPARHRSCPHPYSGRPAWNRSSRS